MTRLLLLSLLLVYMVPSLAPAQLHGTHEQTERTRSPGIQPDTLESVFVAALEDAHNAAAWKQHAAAAFAMKLQLGEADALPISAAYCTTSRACVLSINGKPALGHDGNAAWRTPALDQLGDAVVHVRMLRQLPAMVYRLRDEQHMLTSGPMRKINDRRYYAASVEPTEGDDWSLLLVLPHTNLLHMVAYFIGTSDEDDPAFSPAFAMVAADYETTENIPVARTWHIWRWSRPRGLVGDEPIGKVTISAVSFIKPEASTFARPADAVAKPDDADNDGDAADTEA